MSDSSCSKPKSSNFCKLFGELAFSYNGHLVDCVPKDHSQLVGTILTTDGKVLTREACGQPWELILTPAVFLFYDNKSSVTFEVDTCKKCIQELKPHGRILDSTDKKIYEIKDNQWCPIVDLNAEEHDDCNQHAAGACGGALTAANILSPTGPTGFNAVRSCPTGVTDQYYYYPGEQGLQVTTWNIGGFSEKAAKPCGQISNGVWTAPISADYDVHAVITYQTVNQVTNGLVEDSGSKFDNFLLVLTRDGKKCVVGRVPVVYDAAIEYAPANFEAISGTGTLNAIPPTDVNVPVTVGPLTYPGTARKIHYYLGANGQAVFNQGLRLKKGDTLRLYLVTNLVPITTIALPDQNSPAPGVPSTELTNVNQIYFLDTQGTTLNIHAVECVDDCDVPALPTTLYVPPLVS